MQKRILSLFSPFLIAIIVRLIYVLWGYGFLCAGYVADKTDWGKSNMNSIGFFDTFSWDDSWHYWGIVLILTFLAEMDIWRDENDENQNWFLGHSVFALVFLSALILLFIPSITAFVYTLPVCVHHLFSLKNDITFFSCIFWANITTVFITYIINDIVNDSKSEFHYLAVIIGIVSVVLILFSIVDPTQGFVLLNILAYVIYFILFCIYTILK